MTNGTTTQRDDAIRGGNDGGALDRRLQAMADRLVTERRRDRLCRDGHAFTPRSAKFEVVTAFATELAGMSSQALVDAALAQAAVRLELA